MTSEEHYFSASPQAPAQERRLDLVLAGREVSVVTAGGVFSGDRVDLGTRVLLREVPDPPRTGHLLDLGCGWGPLALTMAMLSPKATVWAVDINERAVALTQANAASMGLRNVRACGPDDVPDDVRFSAIWSNPPIRVGKEALHALLLHWLPRLKVGADAHLVVQRNLGADSLQAWLVAALDTLVTEGGLAADFTVERAGSAKGYRVLTVSQRARPAVGR